MRLRAGRGSLGKSTCNERRPMSIRQTTRPTVLVVDDDLSLRVLTSIVLARVGYSPTAVSGVVRALERVEISDRRQYGRLLRDRQPATHR